VVPVVAAAWFAAWSGAVWAVVDGPFPSSRPADRIQAVGVLGGGIHAPEHCLTLRVLAVDAGETGVGAPARRALAALRDGGALQGERRLVDRNADTIRFTLDPSSLDRLQPSTTPEGLPVAVAAARDALAEARRLLVDGLDLPAPRPVDLVLAHLGPGVGSVFVPSGAEERAGTMWVDASAWASPARIRAEVIHQYAHAVAHGLGLAPAWAEALAGWAALRSGDADAPSVEEAVSARLTRLAEGLPSEDARLALGNAAWLAWLDDARGANALRIALAELAGDPRFAAAMERALRRVDGSGFSEALRDFHLWSVLVGSRDDGRHFPFASRLDDPAFAEQMEGLPFLSIQAAPAVAPGGAAHSVLRPSASTGGVTVRFEGDFGGMWECDLLLRSSAGALHRLAVPLDEQGRGQVTVPAQAAREIVLLVRNAQIDAGPSRRYTWTAYGAAHYPVEFASVRAVPAPLLPGAVSVRWETASESGLVGFHVLRAAADGGEFRRVHPVWVPAVGTAADGALYEFLDPEATPGVRYVYRVDAITEDGLAASSPTTPATGIAETNP
jgi:hypothetical protein